jgi:hypothetical protein
MVIHARLDKMSIGARDVLFLTRREIVEHGDLVATASELSHDVTAKEARPTRDEHSHVFTSRSLD